MRTFWQQSQQFRLRFLSAWVSTSSHNVCCTWDMLGYSQLLCSVDIKWRNFSQSLEAQNMNTILGLKFILNACLALGVREKEQASTQRGNNRSDFPKGSDTAPKLIALFWRWIKAFVLWLRKPECSFPAGLNQHSISPQLRLPAWWTSVKPAEPDRKQNEHTHRHVHS